MGSIEDVLEHTMKSSTNIAKNIIIAVTLGLAAVASWAMTDFPVPSIEASISQTSQG